MNREQEFFLTILKDYIQGCKTNIRVDEIDWSLVLRYAESHQLIAIVYAQCREFIPDSIFEKFKKGSYATVSTNIQRKIITDDIVSTIKNSDQMCFVIKGMAISDYYPNWQYRSMGDTDIVVQNLEKAHSSITKKAFTCISKNKGREYQYRKSGLLFEFHDKLVYHELINNDSVTEFLNNYEDYVVNGRLDDSFHFIFVLYHLQKHFTHRGVGFRQFLDIAVMIKNDKGLRWTWIEEKLNAIGLMDFAKKTFFYIERWFGVVAPITSISSPDTEYICSTEYIFNNGVFGFDNEQNDGFFVSNTIRENNHQKLAMLKIAINKLFPNYKSMAASKYYTFLKGKPFLLPIAWLYRFISFRERKGINEGFKQIQNSFVSKDYLEKREEMFRNWGIG